MPKYMAEGTPEYEAAQAQRVELERKRERREWLQLYRIYERCIEIAEMVWSKKLDAAGAQQHALACAMRDRTIAYGPAASPDERHAELHVPLFTPRDRVQFIKEVAISLNISAEHRGLTVLFPVQALVQGQPEAASGTDEGDEEAQHLQDAGARGAGPSGT